MHIVPSIDRSCVIAVPAVDRAVVKANITVECVVEVRAGEVLNIHERVDAGPSGVLPIRNSRSTVTPAVAVL